MRISDLAIPQTVLSACTRMQKVDLDLMRSNSCGECYHVENLPFQGIFCLPTNTKVFGLVGAPYFNQELRLAMLELQRLRAAAAASEALAANQAQAGFAT